MSAAHSPRFAAGLNRDPFPVRAEVFFRIQQGTGPGRILIIAGLVLAVIIVAVILLPRAPPATASGGNNTVPATESVPGTQPALQEPANTSSSGSFPPAINTALLEQEVHDQVNRVRGEHGLPELGTEPALAGIARAHSRDMAAHGYFGHRNLDEWDATARGAAAGFTCYRDPGHDVSSAIAENLFAVYTDEPLAQETGSGMLRYPATEAGIAEMAADAWMFSPGHRENLLDPGAVREGIGVASSADGLVFVTENLC